MLCQRGPNSRALTGWLHVGHVRAQVTATSMTFARRAVGAALTAVDAIWAGEAQNAFVLCRCSLLCLPFAGSRCV